MTKGKKKGYSKYENPKAKENNRKPVQVGSIIVANVSDYEKIVRKGSKKDHRKEAVTVIKAADETLGVVFLHGKTNVIGNSRQKKVDAGLWEEIEKNGQGVYVDIDIRIKDSKGNDIKQGKVFQNTGIIISPEELEKVESHIYKKKKRNHSIREQVAKNNTIKEKKTK